MTTMMPTMRPTTAGPWSLGWEAACWGSRWRRTRRSGARRARWGRRTRGPRQTRPTDGGASRRWPPCPDALHWASSGREARASARPPPRRGGGCLAPHRPCCCVHRRQRVAWCLWPRVVLLSGSSLRRNPATLRGPLGRPAQPSDRGPRQSAPARRRRWCHTHVRKVQEGGTAADHPLHQLSNHPMLDLPGSTTSCSNNLGQNIVNQKHEKRTRRVWCLILVGVETRQQHNMRDEMARRGGARNHVGRDAQPRQAPRPQTVEFAD